MSGGWEGGVYLSWEIETCVHGICLLLQNTRNIYYPNLRTIRTPKFCSCTWEQQHDNASIDYYAFPLLTTIISKNIIGFHPANLLLSHNHFVTNNGKLLFFGLRPIVGKDVAKKICRMFMDCEEKQMTTKNIYDRKEYQMCIHHMSGEAQCNYNNEVLVGLLECNEKLNKIIENL